MTDNEIRELLLRKYYERRHVLRVELRSFDFEGRISDDDIARVSRDLLRLGLIEGSVSKSLGPPLRAVKASITPAGIDVVEGVSVAPVSVAFHHDASVNISHSTGTAVGNSNHIAASEHRGRVLQDDASCDAGHRPSEYAGAGERASSHRQIGSSRTAREFFFDELFAYAVQFATFSLALALSTNFLRDGDELNKIAQARFAGSPLWDLTWTVAAILVLYGIASMVQRHRPFAFLERFLTEFALEIPRTIYLMGSGLASVIFALALYSLRHPVGMSSQALRSLFYSSGIVAVAAFMYGFGMNRFLKRESIR